MRSGGDIEMLTYSQSNERRSLQVLINHDDPKPEFAYSENDNASLNAAKENNWFVVSMKNDWKRIFLFERKKLKCKTSAKIAPVAFKAKRRYGLLILK